MKATEAKELIIDYLLDWSNSSYHSAVYEAANLWHADVLGVRYNGEITEFEVKVSRADLMNEINVIKECDAKKMLEYAMQIGVEPPAKKRIYSSTKYQKHMWYLNQDKTIYKPWDSYRLTDFRPNLFYFAVPQELVDLALNELIGTPYGVMNLNKINAGSGVARRPKKLHSERHDQSIYLDLLNRQSVVMRGYRYRKDYDYERLLKKVAKEFGVEQGSLQYHRLMSLAKGGE